MSLIRKIQMAAIKANKPAEHFHPLKYWMQRWKKSERETKRLLDVGVKTKLMSIRRFKIPNASGALHNADHWADASKLKKGSS